MYTSVKYLKINCAIELNSSREVLPGGLKNNGG